MREHKRYKKHSKGGAVDEAKLNKILNRYDIEKILGEGLVELDKHFVNGHGAKDYSDEKINGNNTSNTVTLGEDYINLVTAILVVAGAIDDQNINRSSIRKEYYEYVKEIVGNALAAKIDNDDFATIRDNTYIFFADVSALNYLDDTLVHFSGLVQKHIMKDINGSITYDQFFDRYFKAYTATLNLDDMRDNASVNVVNVALETPIFWNIFCDFKKIITERLNFENVNTKLIKPAVARGFVTIVDYYINTFKKIPPGKNILYNAAIAKYPDVEEFINERVRNLKEQFPEIPQCSADQKLYALNKFANGKAYFDDKAIGNHESRKTLGGAYTDKDLYTVDEINKYMPSGETLFQRATLVRKVKKIEIKNTNDRNFLSKYAGSEPYVLTDDNNEFTPQDYINNIMFLFGTDYFMIKDKNLPSISLGIVYYNFRESIKLSEFGKKLFKNKINSNGAPILDANGDPSGEGAIRLIKNIVEGYNLLRFVKFLISEKVPITFVSNDEDGKAQKKIVITNGIPLFGPSHVEIFNNFLIIVHRLLTDDNLTIPELSGKDNDGIHVNEADVRLLPILKEINEVLKTGDFAEDEFGTPFGISDQPADFIKNANGGEDNEGFIDIKAAVEKIDDNKIKMAYWYDDDVQGWVFTDNEYKLSANGIKKPVDDPNTTLFEYPDDDYMMKENLVPEANENEKAVEEVVEQNPEEKARMGRSDTTRENKNELLPIFLTIPGLDVPNEFAAANRLLHDPQIPDNKLFIIWSVLYKHIKDRGVCVNVGVDVIQRRQNKKYLDQYGGTNADKIEETYNNFAIAANRINSKVSTKSSNMIIDMFYRKTEPYVVFKYGTLSLRNPKSERGETGNLANDKIWEFYKNYYLNKESGKHLRKYFNVVDQGTRQVYNGMVDSNEKSGYSLNIKKNIGYDNSDQVNMIGGVGEESPFFKFLIFPRGETKPGVAMNVRYGNVKHTIKGDDDTEYIKNFVEAIVDQITNHIDDENIEVTDTYGNKIRLNQEEIMESISDTIEIIESPQDFSSEDISLTNDIDAVDYHESKSRALDELEIRLSMHTTNWKFDRDTRTYYFEEDYEKSDGTKGKRPVKQNGNEICNISNADNNKCYLWFVDCVKNSKCTKFLSQTFGPINNDTINNVIAKVNPVHAYKLLKELSFSRYKENDISVNKDYVYWKVEDVNTWISKLIDTKNKCIRKNNNKISLRDCIRNNLGEDALKKIDKRIRGDTDDSNNFFRFLQILVDWVNVNRQLINPDETGDRSAGIPIKNRILEIQKNNYFKISPPQKTSVSLACKLGRYKSGLVNNVVRANAMKNITKSIIHMPYPLNMKYNPSAFTSPLQFRGIVPGQFGGPFGSPFGNQFGNQFGSPFGGPFAGQFTGRMRGGSIESSKEILEEIKQNGTSELLKSLFENISDEIGIRSGEMGNKAKLADATKERIYKYFKELDEKEKEIVVLFDDFIKRVDYYKKTNYASDPFTNKYTGKWLSKTEFENLLQKQKVLLRKNEKLNKYGVNILDIIIAMNKKLNDLYEGKNKSNYKINSVTTSYV
jgi:hypothetical protein